MPSELSLRGIAKSFGNLTALHPLTLDIPAGALVALLGPSGCGKTTTLRIIAGFERADAGMVLIGGVDASNLPPNRRQLGMVFQNYSLFPHMSAAENIAFGLKMAGTPKAQIGPRVRDALATVRLAGFEDRFPNQMSGGQQQRVALARSIVTNPKVLLLDEPLGALDRSLRESMQFELRQLQRRLGITTVLVTHDQEEALTMSDRIAVMREGHLEQVGSPTDVYGRPASRFVAEFLGTANVFKAVAPQWSDGVLRATLRDGPCVLEARTDEPAKSSGAEVEIAVRPEDTHLCLEPVDGPNVVAGAVTGRVFRGTYHAVQVEGPGNTLLFAYLSPREAAASPVEVGTRVWLRWSSSDAMVLGHSAR